MVKQEQLDKSSNLKKAANKNKIVSKLNDNPLIVIIKK